MAMIAAFNSLNPQKKFIVGAAVLVGSGILAKFIYDYYYKESPEEEPKKAPEPQTPPKTEAADHLADQPETNPTQVDTPVLAPAVYLEGEDEPNRKKLTYVSKERINHDTFIFKFTFDESKTLGVKVGHHFRIFTTDKEGKPKHHTYTPISKVCTKGEVEVLVKVYFPTSEFPEGGFITQQLHDLSAEDTVTVGGPRGKFLYLGCGKFSMKNSEGETVERTFTKVTYIVGGSAITPVIFLLRHALEDSKDKTEFTLVFSNKTRDDVLLYEEFAAWASAGKLKFVNTLTREKPETLPEGFSNGRISQELIASSIPAPSDDHVVFFCGPKGFDDTAKTILADLHHRKENLISL